MRGEDPDEVEQWEKDALAGINNVAPGVAPGFAPSFASSEVTATKGTALPVKKQFQKGNNPLINMKQKKKNIIIGRSTAKTLFEIQPMDQTTSVKRTQSMLQSAAKKLDSATSSVLKKLGVGKGKIKKGKIKIGGRGKNKKDKKDKKTTKKKKIIEKKTKEKKVTEKKVTEKKVTVNKVSGSTTMGMTSPSLEHTNSMASLIVAPKHPEHPEHPEQRKQSEQIEQSTSPGSAGSKRKKRKSNLKIDTLHNCTTTQFNPHTSTTSSTSSTSLTSSKTSSMAMNKSTKDFLIQAIKSCFMFTRMPVSELAAVVENMVRSKIEK